VNSHRRRDEDEETSFAVVSFATEPPPGGPADVYSAQTAVAVLPDSFLADLRRGKAEDPVTAKYKVLADVDVVDALPSAPPAPSADAAVDELTAAVTAALAAARVTQDAIDAEPVVTSDPLAVDIVVVPETLPPAFAAPVVEPRQLPRALVAALVLMLLVAIALVALASGWKLAGLLGAP
jgi:hypothetical protein